MQAEIWKEIPGYEGLCEVSDLGRVRTMDRQKHAGAGRYYTLPGRIRSIRYDKDGYCLVTLTDATGSNQTHKVHRLVAQVFDREPLADEEINHRNSKRDDNRAENLHWVSHTDNIRDSYTRRVGPRRKSIVALPLSAAVGFWFPSVSDVKKLGFNRNSVHQCLSGEWGSYNGFTWRYL